MTTRLNDLMAELSPADRRDVERRKKAHLKAMEDARHLDEIRRAAGRKQGDVAVAMGIGQNAVSQLEKRRDLQLSTLSRYVESVGFRLEVSVVAPSGERVTLKNFRPWDDPAPRVASRARAKGHKAAPRKASTPARATAAKTATSANKLR